MRARPNPWLVWLAQQRQVPPPGPRFSSAERRRPSEPEWPLARWARRKPGFAAWAFACTLTVCFLHVMERPQHEWTLPEWLRADEVEHWTPEVVNDPVLLEEFSRAVNDALVVIGHGLIVDRVVVLPPYISTEACYIARDNTICISQRYKGEVAEDKELVFVAAHECVHAMFMNAGLEQHAHLDRDQATRVEETTAYVLGAHIAGAVLTRRGEDGERAMREYLERYRGKCDPKKPGSVHRKFRRMQDTMHIDGHDPDSVKSLEVHFWSPRMVDEIEAICQAYPDPWEAAHVVAKKYHLTD